MLSLGSEAGGHGLMGNCGLVLSTIGTAMAPVQGSASQAERAAPCAAEWRTPVRLRGGRQHPPLASIPHAGEHVQRERPAQQPAQSWRGVRSFFGSSIVAAKAGLHQHPSYPVQRGQRPLPVGHERQHPLHQEHAITCASFALQEE